MTWLLCGSVHTSYMELPTTARLGDRIERDPDLWLQQLQDQVEAGTDWDLAQVPRERLDNFRDPVRFKSWQSSRRCSNARSVRSKPNGAPGCGAVR